MERTDGKNSKLFSFSNRVKPAWLQGFWWTKRTASRKISSAAPSTSRTTLRVCISICFFFAQISVKKFLERKAGENTEKYSIYDFENPYKWGISGGRNDQAAVKFRVSPVMTTSIRFRIYPKNCCRFKILQQFGITKVLYRIIR